MSRASVRQGTALDFVEVWCTLQTGMLNIFTRPHCSRDKLLLGFDTRCCQYHITCLSAAVNVLFMLMIKPLLSFQIYTKMRTASCCRMLRGWSLNCAQLGYVPCQTEFGLTAVCQKFCHPRHAQHLKSFSEQSRCIVILSIVIGFCHILVHRCMQLFDIIGM